MIEISVWYRFILECLTFGLLPIIFLLFILVNLENLQSYTERKEALEDLDACEKENDRIIKEMSELADLQAKQQFELDTCYLGMKSLRKDLDAAQFAILEKDEEIIKLNDKLATAEKAYTNYRYQIGTQQAEIYTLRNKIHEIATLVKL